MWTQPPKRDASQLPELFHKNPRLSGVAAIARAVAATEYDILNKIDYRKNGEAATPLPDHEILYLLDHPMRRYPEIDSYALFYMTEAFTKLIGECYWLKVRDESGHVVELDIIPPAWVMGTPTISVPYYIVYPYGTTSANSLHVPPADMVRFLRPNLTDPYGRGRGDSEPLEDEFQTDEYLAKMQGNFAFNDATPPYIISAPGMPQDQATAFKESWKQKVGGFLHRREPGVLGFDAKVITLGMTPQELDMMASRRFIADMSREHYQIPPEILGSLQNSNRATISASFFLYNKNVLSFEFGFIEKTVTRQLIEPDFDAALMLKFKPAIPEDEEFKLKVMSEGVRSGWVEVDEARQAFKLAPLPNGKGKVFLRTFSTYEVRADGKETEVPLESGKTEPATILPDGMTEDEAKNIIAVEIIDKSEEVHIVTKAEAAKIARREAIWKAFDARATSHEKEFIEAVKGFSGKQKAKVIDALKSKEIDAALSNGKDYEREIDLALDAVFDMTSDKALKSALAPVWLECMQSGRDHTLDMIGKNNA